MEYMELGNLADNIDRAPLYEKEVRVIMQQLFKAVNELHGKHIAHRDLKPEVCGIA
jgi:serine/threonine protein kinase